MQLKTDERQREVKDHGTFAFPVNPSMERLSAYERGAFIWHWHKEVELTLILSGQIRYQVNDRVYDLHAGDGLFCNANALHTGHRIDGQDCRYLAVTFHPRAVYGFEGSAVQREYVTPVLTDAALGSLAFRPGEPGADGILGALREIYELYKEPPAGYEMLLLEKLMRIWHFVYLLAGEKAPAPGQGRDIERLRRILSYIQGHYAEKITLEDIASRVSICKSECCRFFKKYMRESLFDYLLYYRVEMSLPLLAAGEKSVTEIAEQTGFSSPGYFARVFKAQMGCTPGNYRKTHGQGTGSVVH